MTIQHLVVVVDTKENNSAVNRVSCNTMREALYETMQCCMVNDKYLSDGNLMDGVVEQENDTLFLKIDHLIFTVVTIA